MEEEKKRSEEKSILKRLNFSENSTKIYSGVVIFAIIAGIGTGFLLSTSASGQKIGSQISLNQHPQAPQADTKTFSDFAEGKITKKPEPKKGQIPTEGTHLLIRDGATEVTLTSSVVDLSQYENKKVKVYGSTQQVPNVAWFMDVGKVEVK